MTPLEFQAFVGRMLPSDINCQLRFSLDGIVHVDVANWCESREATMFHVEQLDQSEDMLKRTLRPFLYQAVKDLRDSQTKNRYGSA
jgi:hypothetical protein